MLECSVPVWAGPDQLETFLAFHLDQGGVDRSGEARVVQLDREVIAALGGDFCHAAPSSTLAAAKMRKCGPLSEGFSTRTSLALTLRLRVLIEPVKPLPVEAKVPMVAMCLIPLLLGPRLSRPRWRSMDRRRSTGTSPGAGTKWKTAGSDFLGSRGMRTQFAGEESRGGRCRDKIERPLERGRPSVRPVTSRTQMDVALREPE